MHKYCAPNCYHAVVKENCSFDKPSVDLENLLLSLAVAIQKNTDILSQLLTQDQFSYQFQKLSDQTKFENIGDNDVTVFSYIDPDSVTKAYSSNSNDIDNEAVSFSSSISKAFSLVINEILEQNGLLNVEK